MILDNKYDLSFSKEAVEKDIVRLTNQVWKLIPMKEHDEDWLKQLDTVLIEIAGLDEIFIQAPQFLQILSKLEGIKKNNNIDFFIYRKTIFEIINLLQEIRYE